VTASHWHDDHIRGLSEIVDECKSAEFAMSLALHPKAFVQLVQAAGTDPMVTSFGVDEYFRILQILVTRKTVDARTIAPTWAVADKRLWQRIDGQPDAEIWSLAPSNESVTQSLQSFGSLLAEQEGTKRAVRSVRPNLATTVLWVRVGDCCILLGGDLEETGSPGTGWTAIVDSSARPGGRADIFKVPHHGSSNADQPRVWTDMVADPPIAILTPWIRGNQSLPTEKDRRRICGYTSDAYLTSDPSTPTPRRRRPRVVEKTIDSATRRLRTLEGRMGHVRLRRSAIASDAKWSVELMGAAQGMCRRHR
jgi:hypothetical protein